MNGRVLALIAVGVTGCGLTENGFRAERARLECEREAECAGEVVDCSTAPVPAASTIISCDFDADAAEGCLDAIPAAECAGTGITPPGVCSQVLVNCQNSAG